jgi:hypothetical protein
MTPVMLARALAQTSAIPGEDGCYSTAQLIESVFGSMHQEKIALRRKFGSGTRARAGTRQGGASHG